MTSPLSAERVRALLGTAKRQKTPAKATKPTAAPLHHSISNRHADGRWVPNLRSEEVRDIRARYKAGETGRTIAADYGISQPLVSMIGTGQRKARVV